MRSHEERELVRRLSARGMTDAAVARETGLPRSTVRGIRAPTYVPVTDRAACLRCWLPSKPVLFTQGEYAELLGWYLGDGHISRLGRSYQLRIFADAKYEKTDAELRRLLERPFYENRVGSWTPKGKRLEVLRVSHKHLACLFPQHGPGKKHHRTIRLEPWQQEQVDLAPFRFLRGLIHSDGCRFINRTGPYSYVSYSFNNESQDILDLFCATCDAVGVAHRRVATGVRIYQRAAVALLEDHVGPKR
jgi:hypothetical protein